MLQNQFQQGFYYCPECIQIQSRNISSLFYFAKAVKLIEDNTLF